MNVLHFESRAANILPRYSVTELVALFHIVRMGLDCEPNLSNLWQKNAMAVHNNIV